MILYYFNDILVSRNDVDFNISHLRFAFMWYDGINKDGYIYVGY